MKSPNPAISIIPMEWAIGDVERSFIRSVNSWNCFSYSFLARLSLAFLAMLAVNGDLHDLKICELEIILFSI